MASSRTQKTISAGKDVKKSVPCTWLIRMKTGSTSTENNMEFPQKLRTWLSDELIWKDRDAGKDWSREEKGTTEDEMVGWHHPLTEHEFELTLAVGDGRGGLACCSPWGCRVRHNWATELNWSYDPAISLLCIYLKGRKQDFKDIYALLCLLKHYSE